MSEENRKSSEKMCCYSSPLKVIHCTINEEILNRKLHSLFSDLFLIPLSHFTLKTFVRDFTLIASYAYDHMEEVKCAKRQELEKKVFPFIFIWSYSHKLTIKYFHKFLTCLWRLTCPKSYISWKASYQVTNTDINE